MNRRLFALLLTVAMLLALVACGKNNVPEETVLGVISGADDGDLGDSVAINTIPAQDVESPATEAATSTEATAAKVDVTEPVTDETVEETKAPETEPVVPSAPAAQITEYEWYNSLSGEEQMAFMESFDSVPAFFDWYNAAKAEYEELNPSIEIGDGVIDLGNLAGGNG